MNHILEIEREDKPAGSAQARAEQGFVRPEILAPAGNREMMQAAVENGADAVYFGLQEFNARIRAANFSLDELPEVMAWLHTRGLRGYVTLNTLVFASELPGIARVVQACNQAGVDAVLVQDLGLARLIAEMAPELPVHASTQMTLTSAESILGAEALGLKLERVVAARETSIKELKTLRRGTDKEIEVFVHGAICVAYSGQCLTSEALGGRSANRGECAQACRLPYDLIVDGKKEELGDVRYLLSPKDLSGYEDIGALIRGGIVSLKIEGRLKSPEYVAATVQAYRKAVDEAMGQTAGKVIDPVLDLPTREMLEMTFSRGFTGGYLHATNHQAVVEGRFPKKRGLYLGEVSAVYGHSVEVQLVAPLKPGDGVVFDAGRPDSNEEGGRIYSVEADRDRDPAAACPEKPVMAHIEFGHGAIQFRHLSAGNKVWKTSDPAMDKKLNESFAGSSIRFRRPVVAHVEGTVGAPLKLILTHHQGERVEVVDTAPAEAARSRPLNHQVLFEQFGRLGGTPFYLDNLTLRLDNEIMVPMSRLNAMRRAAVEVLLNALAHRGRNRQAPAFDLNAWRADSRKVLPEGRFSTINPEASLSVLCRSLEQVKAAVDHPDIHTIYTDFEDIRLHREARQLVPRGSKRFVPATLRVIKPGEAPFVRKLMEAEPDAVLIRNLAAWEVLRHQPNLPLLGDYSLNVANDLTAGLLMSNGFQSLTPSYDLNIDQLSDLLAHSKPEWFEVTIHQQLPMFHMEHCVFCRFLSEGTDFTNCGRPCETHEIELKDRLGYRHPVKADAGCRNTVFNAHAQSGSAYLDRLLRAGVRRFRIELMSQNYLETKEAIDAYLPAIRGEVSGHDVWRKLKAVSKLGVTRGSLDHE